VFSVVPQEGSFNIKAKSYVIQPVDHVTPAEQDGVPHRVIQTETPAGNERVRVFSYPFHNVCL